MWWCGLEMSRVGARGDDEVMWCSEQVITWCGGGVVESRSSSSGGVRVGVGVSA